MIVRSIVLYVHDVLAVHKCTDSWTPGNNLVLLNWPIWVERQGMLQGFVKRVVFVAVGGTVAAGAAVHLISSLLSPPQKLPFLFDAMFVSLAFVHIVACFLYLNYRQWTQT